MKEIKKIVKNQPSEEALKEVAKYLMKIALK